MEITNRDAAIEMADNLRAKQAEPIIQEIEERIQTWVGPPTTISIYRYNDIDFTVWQTVKQLYEDQGWTVELTSSYLILK